MGFPAGYTEVFLPKLFLHLLSFLGFIRSLIISLFHFLGLSDLLETDVSWPEPTTSATRTVPSSCVVPASALALRECIPVMKLKELIRKESSSSAKSFERDSERCAVCLCEIEEEDEIRWLEKCNHIFHRCCLDRWIDHEQTTCPLCRTPFAALTPKAEIEVDDYDHHQNLWISYELNTNQFL